MKRSPSFTREISFIEPNQKFADRHYIAATISIFLLTLLHTAIAYAVVEFNLHRHNIRIDKYVNLVALMYAMTLAGFLFFYPIFVMIIVRPKRLTNYLANGYRWHLFSKERLFFSYPILTIIPLEKSIYSSFKNEMPKINAFWLDEPLYKLDRAIFFGNDPWRTLQQIIGVPEITRTIDILYHPAWLSLLSATLLFHALGRHDLQTRLRFFISYIFIWAFLGNALATVLSSAGPCYFTQVTGQTSPYAELMEYLHSIQPDGVLLSAVQTQEKLWNGHISSTLHCGGGISAMPSIHIATTMLFALSMHQAYPSLEKFFYCYVIIIWIGSIHLGWHYASDGLLSGLCVMAIWHFSGKLTNKIITLNYPV